MSANAITFIEKCNITTKMSVSELSPNFLKILRMIGRRLREGYNFNEEQIFTLIPIRKAGRRKEIKLSESSTVEANINYSVLNIQNSKKLSKN